ncbi:MAG: hypothetical protein B6D61_11280 [Bacteroidetes bacterium 4484_249]|nr:MAG: hypothetical protein B6D61_11280 [Bacteroidetes bacterium 4484_249]
MRLASYLIFLSGTVRTDISGTVRTELATFDENDDLRHIKGLTDPDTTHTFQNMHNEKYRNDYENKVLTIFAGTHIKSGDYAEGKGITHVTILRTIEAMYGLPKAGAQQINASAYGISPL